MSIEKNVEEFKKVNVPVIVSIGITDSEFERAKALYEAGAQYMCIDVAHAASTSVVNQYIRCVREFKDVKFLVGNFATAQSINVFVGKCRLLNVRRPDAFKVGIGGGSNCTTRIVTGCGLPSFESALDCVKTGFPIVLDGGIRNSGDFSKAMAAGCVAVMVGSLLSGTDESPGEIVDSQGVAIAEHLLNADLILVDRFKSYRGSASLESYEVQGKMANHRTPEGISRLVEYKGSIKDVVQQLDAGLRSSLTYLGAKNLKEFRENAEFVQITTNGLKESNPH